MNRRKQGAREFVSEFETQLFGILGFYLFLVTSMLCGLAGLMLAEWIWPRVGWIQTLCSVVGIMVGGLVGLFAFAAIKARLVERGRSRVLWILLWLIPGAAVPLVIAELTIRGLRKWSEKEEE
ncbi:hypothetical protein [Nodularia spumigena]|uniref:hypothetical protein n=1 Tax=Nodularia spumigena TaxID=70799 RepID=UPI002B20BFED|nr:hypothetical protein [Nodularia spumigena]MEA5556282.1 hypothetical protein [Nodularia spumigena CH309]